ncbi:MAG: hypothetical protein ABSH38_17895 [Verrucomicrobiota bacterium]|jgi:hypothetical protein
MKSLTKLCLILIAGTALATLPANAQNASTNASTNAAPAAPQRPRAPRFGGKISAVDAANMTLTLAGRAGAADTKVKITSSTKITKDREPATFADATVGLTVSGTGKKAEDGSWEAATLAIRSAAPKPAAPAPPPPSGQK